MSAALQAGAVTWFRVGHAIFRQVKENGLDYRAMSLVYTSLLALIPLLAVSFSILKAFGADAYLEPFLLEILKPLQGNTESVAATILDSVKRLDVGVLGSVGLLSLLYTSVSLLDKIEEFFNHIWRKKTLASRSLFRRFSDYLSFILVGPLLVFSAFGGMNEIFRRANDARWFDGDMSLFLAAFQAVLPFALTVAAFVLLYLIIPDAPVKPASALFGGLAAALLWRLVGWVFGTFMAGSAQYHAVYSTFAILVLFMVWLYMSWLIVLLGVQVTFFHQHPRYIHLRTGDIRLSAKLSERLGLLLMVLIGRRFFHGERPWNMLELSEHLALPDECVDELLKVLIGKGFVIGLGGEARAFAPARDFSTIAVMDVVDAMRSAHGDDVPVSQEALADPSVDRLLASFDGAVRDTLADLTIRDLIVEK